ncbi:MAG: endonuclease III domain-containing protein [Desulfovibrio sp.]|uniref:endonuclease III domain-containing protein n=1 Tax=Desulfovibrio sp. 7SRBS1 TaxID=3378064 RepID=UPI003B41EF95
MQRHNLLLNYFSAMHDALGPSNWWPGDSPFEIAVGAVLTQNTNWGNVEKAMNNLRAEKLLTPAAMTTLTENELAERIRPAGFFRLKSARLGNLLRFLRCRAPSSEALSEPSLAFLREQDMDSLRDDLLNIKGIGPETADSILLYALEYPSFVADAYTARLLHRHGHLPPDAPYNELRDFFMDTLPPDVATFNEYHALIVRVGKTWCKKSSPKCGECPLSSFLDQMP